MNNKSISITILCIIASLHVCYSQPRTSFYEELIHRANNFHSGQYFPIAVKNNDTIKLGVTYFRTFLRYWGVTADSNYLYDENKALEILNSPGMDTLHNFYVFEEVNISYLNYLEGLCIDTVNRMFLEDDVFLKQYKNYDCDSNIITPTIYYYYLRKYITIIIGEYSNGINVKSFNMKFPEVYATYCKE